LLALADTKIVEGDEQLTRAKISSAVLDGNQWWLMTSGLRSIRDKVDTAYVKKTQAGSLCHIYTPGRYKTEGCGNPSRLSTLL